MITLLIVSVALAAMAPIMSRQIKNSSAPSSQANLPKDMVAFFDAASCPEGWVKLAGDGYEGRFPRFSGNFLVGNNDCSRAEGCTVYYNDIVLPNGSRGEDAIRNITGAYRGQDGGFGWAVPATGVYTGVLSGRGVGSWKAADSYGYGKVPNNHDLVFDLRNIVPIAAENRPRYIAFTGCKKL